MRRRWLAVLILAALATGSAWYLQRLEETNAPSDRGPQHQPDFYMEAFTALTTDGNGVARRKLTAERLEHFPDTDTNELTRPHLEFYKEGQEPWHVVSERGWVSAERDVVLLQGRVHVWQPGPAGQPVIDIVTRDVRVLPGTEYAETEEPALIRTPESETHGVGLRAYLGQNRFELLSQVRSILNGQKISP